jgi:hypothetical protein
LVFDYYHKLTRAQQRIYRDSDAIAAVRLNNPGLIIPVVRSLDTALRSERRASTERICQRLAHMLSDDLGMRRLDVAVLSARPHDSEGELHGQYQLRDDATAARMTVWMRTARQRRVVAFRTFLRTFLHEFGHHLDYELLGLADSFHTEGFFRRESSLLRQLAPRKKAVRKSV